MIKEYVTKEQIIDIISQAYEYFLPSYHAPIIFIESAVKTLVPADEKEEE